MTPSMRKSSSLAPFALLFAAAGLQLPAQEPSGFAFDLRADRLVISRASRPIADYVFKDAEILRPYFANVRTLGGVQATRNHPPIAGKDADDHAAMHPGIWLAFGDINGADFWRNKGRIEHVRFTREPRANAGRLTFSALSALRAENGDTVCEMESRFLIALRDSGWTLVWRAIFRSDAGEFTFGDQEEMGFGARVATAITEKNGGRILSSSGAQSAKATWGQPADWCDYAGSIDGKQVGIAVMFAPGQFRKSWWHNRDYGLIVANPFGREAMKQGEKSAVTVKPGETFELSFGAFIHESPEGAEPDLARAYADFSALAAEGLR